MIPKIEDCSPGLKPTHYNVVVAVDALEEVSAGGIILPSKHTERETSASEKGLLVDVSPMAFSGGDWVPDAVPQKGATVLYQRYAGSEFEGADGRKYRIMADEDLKGFFYG